MKATWIPEKGKLVASSHTPTNCDNEPFFGNRKIIEISSSEIANILISAGVPGASHTNGRRPKSGKKSPGEFA